MLTSIVALDRLIDKIPRPKVCFRFVILYAELANRAEVVPLASLVFRCSVSSEIDDPQSFARGLYFGDLNSAQTRLRNETHGSNIQLRIGWQSRQIALQVLF